MNRTQELKVFDWFVDEHYFEPSKNWPKYEFTYRSYCRWALSEIRKSLAERPNIPVLDILSDLYRTMEDASAEAESKTMIGITNDKVPVWLIFAVGREMTEIVAGLYL